jgi:putative membrane-bound dehydrogenase-like protein
MTFTLSSFASLRLCVRFFVVSYLCAGSLLAADPSGPAAEQRFPPLKLPGGFKATLFACDPFIEYPSAIAVGPRPGTLFVAVDYMTGLGTEIIRRDEVRLLEDTDSDGYADRSTVFAERFNSIMGLAWSDRTLFVMHAPFLTAVRDTDGDGVGDERRDLLTGLGLPPEENPVRLHCANGVTAGEDGWLYIALGDHGCNVPRPEGDRLVFNGGGILRCRPDGRDLHVFARGLRNIYDVALDAEANVFVRDNENDGGTYKQRVYHTFYGADHGYPYLYENRPDEALAPLADVGLGSSAGVACYLAEQFPAEYRGNLFCCEWGRSIVRYELKPQGSSFAPVKELEFAIGADNDPYPFKPTDVVVDHSGALVISDWCDGQRPARGRGRIYRITYAGNTTPSPHVGEGAKRRHDEPSLDDLVQLAQSNSDSSVRVQAIHAIADMTDPILSQHRLDAGAGDAKIAARLAALAEKAEPRIVREVIVALGRLQWFDAPTWLRKQIRSPDVALGHAAMQTLRQSKNWPAVLQLLNEPDDQPLRAIAIRSLAEQSEPAIATSLIERLSKDSNADHRRQYADLLARIYKKPGPWVYWGYRPPPKPANTVAWDHTEAIAQALNNLLADTNSAVRLAALASMQREKIPTQLRLLSAWLKQEREARNVAAILESLTAHPAGDIQSLLIDVARLKDHALENRLRAVAILTAGANTAPAETLATLTNQLEDGPVLAEFFRATLQQPQIARTPILLAKLASPSPEVRAIAIDALAERRSAEAYAPIITALNDADIRVRRAAAEAAGKLKLREAIEPLLKLAADAEPALRCISFDALRLLEEPRVVPLAVKALADRQCAFRALRAIGELGGPENAQVIIDLAKRDQTAEVLTAVAVILDGWSRQAFTRPTTRAEFDQTIAELSGHSGVPLRWQVIKASPQQREAILAARRGMKCHMPTLVERSGWKFAFTEGSEARVRFDEAPLGTSMFAYTEIDVPDHLTVEFLAASNGTLRIDMFGSPGYQREKPTPFRADSDRFHGQLSKGLNRILIEVSDFKGPAEFSLRFRRESDKAEHEQLMRAVLERSGNPNRGRELFLNAEKSLCIKCHRLGEQGERIGPELTGVGSRFSRTYVVESILDPSRTIAPSFDSVSALLTDGRIVSGIKTSETEAHLTLADNQGKKHALAKAEIDELQPQRASTMPEGLEKRLTTDEFIDLVTFLMSQKK